MFILFDMIARPAPKSRIHAPRTWMPALFLVTLWLVAMTCATAHPMSQYRVEITPSPGGIAIEVLSALDRASPPPAPAFGNMEDPPLEIPRFPIFLMSADGLPVAWKEATPTRESDAYGEWLSYRAAYAFDPLPSHLRISLDPKEQASVVVVVRHANGDTITHLLSAQQPAEIDLKTAAFAHSPPPGKPDSAASISTSPSTVHDSPSSASPPVSVHPPSAGATAAIFGEYTEHGIWHILTGYDHMLFMAALVLAAVSLWDLVKVVTAFTLAHTVTLTLAVFDIVRLSPKIVEPMIALSIVFVAVQNMYFPRSSRGWTRLAVAFAFGLFHGLGFAGGLLETMAGLGGVTIVTAIVAFSLGVELGHQFVVIPLYTARIFVRRAAGSHAEAVSRGLTFWGSALIAIAGAYYVIVSVFPFD
jgi:hydrogenase/urease accessory protein HupE